MSDSRDFVNSPISHSSFLARVIADALQPLVANVQATQTTETIQTNSPDDNFSAVFFAADTPQAQRVPVNNDQQKKANKPENLASENGLPRIEAEAKSHKHLVTKSLLNQPLLKPSLAAQGATPKPEQEAAVGYSKATSAVSGEQTESENQPEPADQSGAVAPQGIAQKIAATRHSAREAKLSSNAAKPALIIRARAPADFSQDLASPQKQKIATPKTPDSGAAKVQQPLKPAVTNTTANSLQAAVKPYVYEANALARAQQLQPVRAPAATNLGLYIGQVILRVEDSAAAPKHTAATTKTEQAQPRAQADRESRQFLRTL